MKILQAILAFLVSAALLAAGVVVLWISWLKVEDARRYAGLIEYYRPAAAITGIVLLVLAVLLLVSRMNRRRRGSLSFDREGGRVSIDTRVIEDYISKIAAEFPAVIRMQPRVIASRESVDITVDIRIKAGPQIKEICELLQQRVRESMLTGMGISQVRYVEVNVLKIVGQTEPDLKAASDDEGL